MYWNDLNTHLKRQYGCKVYKLALSSGCSCPNRDGTLGVRGCIFCDGAGAFAEAGDIPAQLAAARQRVAAKAGQGAKYIAYFQSFTNTYAPVEVLEPLYTAALAPEDVVALSIATRPDCLPEDVLDLLTECNKIKPVMIELGLQSIHPSTVSYIRRGYDLPVYDKAVNVLHQRGIEVVTHVIAGLPGESKEDFLATVRHTAAVHSDGIKLQLLHVLQGTDLAADYAAGKFRTLSMEEYLDWITDSLLILPPDMVIHRLTGDGPKNLLIAPAWSSRKREVLNTLHRQLKEKNLWQGKEFMNHGE